MAQKDIESNTYPIDSLISKQISFKNYEVLKWNKKEKILYCNHSLRLSYDKLILACGLDTDFIRTEGLLYSIKDENNPIFSSYEYDEGASKMSRMTFNILKQFKNTEKLGKRNQEFIETGNGNIIFCSVKCQNDNSTGFVYDIIENMQLCLLLYTLINKYRRKTYVDSCGFKILIPCDEKFFLDIAKNVGNYLLKEIKNKNIEIIWNFDLKKVKDYNLIDENGNRISYNYAHVIPNLVTPSLVKFELNHKTEDLLNTLIFDRSNLTLKDNPDIYAIGDILNNFEDRFLSNIFQQTSVIAKNIKIDHFRLNNISKIKYEPNLNTFLDFDLENYIINKQENISSLKKNYLTKILVNNFYLNSNSVLAKYFLKNILNIEKFKEINKF